MKFKKMQIMSKLLLLPFLLTLFFFSSCTKEESPIKSGSSVTVTNTFESTAQTSGVETTIEDVFGLSANALAATATVEDAVEFPNYLLGLYDIDIDESKISFELVAAANDTTYSSFFRTIEPNTKDRYYLTFDEAQNVSGFSSDNTSVTLRMDSDKVLVVEIGEGFNFNPGTSFSITLN